MFSTEQQECPRYINKDETALATDGGSGGSQGSVIPE
jgi:hypothetical protein